MPATSRIAIVGAGHVGATTAYALMLRGLIAEIVLIDQSIDHAIAEAT
ncbi:MAG: FAD-dependent oxidoreductase, partial [Alphaproteobacteria bacterium]